MLSLALRLLIPEYKKKLNEKHSVKTYSKESCGKNFFKARLSTCNTIMTSTHELPLSNSLYNDNNAISCEALYEYKPKLKRQVGLLGCVSLIVGTMIGSGIFASTSAVFVNSGSTGMALIVWSGSGVLVAMISLCYVELGTMIPLSGGEYSYYLEAFGELVAFIFSYASTLFLRPTSLAAILLASGNYMVEPFFVYGCNPEEKNLISKILAAFFLGGVIFIAVCLFLLLS